MELARLEGLIGKVEDLKGIMINVSTGKDRLAERDPEYRKLYREVSAGLAELSGEGHAFVNPNRFRSLEDWWVYCRSNLPKWQGRREHVLKLYDDLLTGLDKVLHDNRAHQIRWGGMAAATAALQGRAVPVKRSFSLTFEHLHPKIVHAAQVPFDTKQYDDAILNAFKMVEEEIRARAAAAPDDIGVNLVSQSMKPEAPKLVFSPVKAEQEAAHSLYRGAIGAFKNPRSHRFLNTDDPIMAFEAVTFASLLMRMLDEAKSQ